MATSGEATLNLFPGSDCVRASSMVVGKMSIVIFIIWHPRVLLGQIIGTASPMAMVGSILEPNSFKFNFFLYFLNLNSTTVRKKDHR